ncbi:MAG TPA: DUF3662 and FHA domain-containing protein [Nocardioidaceae bacterium]|nr:DUF3662 and FHA domain-containing protein [Nocardioidaceae bacterium]
MSALHRFERRLEQLVTGVFARAFRSAVQPMEIAAALQREIDNSAQILSRERRLAPNSFTIDLSPVDFDRMSSYGETLSSELAQMLHEHAAEQGYLFAGPVQLQFLRTDDLTTGRFRVRSQASATVTAPAAARQPGSGQAAPPGAADEAPVSLEINGVRHPVEAPGIVVGRGNDADLRIEDPGVSRRHAEFRVQPGPGGRAPLVTLTDLDSTNGTSVNGRPIEHTVVGEGTVVQLGTTTITVHLRAAPATGRPAGANPPAPAYPAPGPSAGQPGG